MNSGSEERMIVIVTACMQTDGLPTFVVTNIEATEEDVHNGIHYARAEAQLLEGGYEEPFVHFADQETPAFLAAVRPFLNRVGGS